MEHIPIHTEFIKLDQLLKLANAVDSGGAAKTIIAEGLVKVNGETERRKGKKIHSGDTVEVEGIGSFLVG